MPAGITQLALDLHAVGMPASEIRALLGSALQAIVTEATGPHAA